MKEIIRVFFIFALLITAVSCATTPITLPKKYNLDKELEEVDRISSFNLDSWESVDRQSIILEAGRDDYYLLILRRPMTSAHMNLRIGVDDTVSSISAGFDRIIIREFGGPAYYMIEKIYKFKDKEQKNEIKEKLRKNKA